MANDEKKSTERELSKAAIKAFKEVLKLAKQDPSTIIIAAESKDGLETTANEITEWLFHRRQEDGNKRN